MATNHHPLPDRDTPRAAREEAAQRLADSLRRARLTLLFGEPGAGKSPLLADGLLPLLRRRSADATVSVKRQAPQVVLPFPDRRARGRASLVEMAIFLDAWNAQPLTSLHDGIDAALRASGIDPEWHRERLTDRLQSLASRFGTRFLFVLDGLEGLLQAPDKAEASESLIDELTHLLNLPVPANLLIALRADAQDALIPLRRRLYGVPVEVLELEAGRIRQVGRTASAEASLPTAAAAAAAASSPVVPPPVAPGRRPPLAAAKEAAPAPTQAPAPAAMDLSNLRHRLTREAANTGAPTRPGDVGSTVARQAPAPAPKAGSTAPPRRPFPMRRVALVSGAFVAVAVGALVFWVPPSTPDQPVSEPSASAQTIAATLPTLPAPSPAAPPTVSPITSTAPPATAAPPARPSFVLRVDANDAGERLPRELASALTADGSAALRLVPGEAALPATAASAGLAIVRYDALQAASRASPKPTLGIVAPLYTEELQVVVRADSKLRFIHQLEGRRIAVGAAQGERALTGQALYRQMFGRALPPVAGKQPDAATALQRLIAGDGGIDAVLLVSPQPDAALAALPPAQRQGLRLLALAPDHPASRRALQAYLPATVRESGGAATPTLAAMSFLVATGKPDAEETKRLGQLATSLCRSLPVLQRDGDPKWRALTPGLQLETGWPQAAATDAAWRACGAAGTSAARAADRSSPTPATRN